MESNGIIQQLNETQRLTAGTQQNLREMQQNYEAILQQQIVQTQQELQKLRDRSRELHSKLHEIQKQEICYGIPSQLLELGLADTPETFREKVLGCWQKSAHSCLYLHFQGMIPRLRKCLISTEDLRRGGLGGIFSLEYWLAQQILIRFTPDRKSVHFRSPSFEGSHACCKKRHPIGGTARRAPKRTIRIAERVLLHSPQEPEIREEFWKIRVFLTQLKERFHLLKKERQEMLRARELQLEKFLSEQ